MSASVVAGPSASPVGPIATAPAEVAALLQAARDTRYAPLFALFVHTGLRRGAALALRWTDVDLDRGTLRIRGPLSRIDGALVVTEPRDREVQALRAHQHPH